MGAKVYYFQWIDDFSAAKNFAIEQASGDWIAFLDADEYFLEEDAKKLPQILYELENKELKKSGKSIKCNVIKSSWVQLNADGNILSIMFQCRIFKNGPSIRYVGRIHENIANIGSESLVTADMRKQLNIYHTGYAWTEESRATKTERNLSMLYRELELNPDSATLHMYLAETLCAARETDKGLYFAKMACKNRDNSLNTERLSCAYQTVLYLIYEMNIENISEEIEKEFFKFYDLAITHDPEYPDFDIAAGFLMYTKESWSDVIHYMNLSLQKSQKGDIPQYSRMAEILNGIYSVLAVAYEKEQDYTNSFFCATTALRINPYQENLLTPMLHKLAYHDTATAEEILMLLEKIYDFSKQKDILFILKAVKKESISDLEELLVQYLTEENRNIIYPEEKKIIPERKLSMRVDVLFYEHINKFENISYEGMVAGIKESLNSVAKADVNMYENIIADYNTLGYWGKLRPDEDNYELIEKRVNILKGRISDFIWLYEKLADYRSRRTLLGIIENWLYFSQQSLSYIKEQMYDQYFDPDIYVCDENDVVVDAGAFQGDTLNSYMNTYGKQSFKRYYCYEASPQNVTKLHEMADGMDNVIIRECAVSSEKGTTSFYMNANYPTVAFISDDGETEVETVTLDEDISERITLIKMDIEGAEMDALRGAKNHIKEEHPKLAISVYHSNSDILDIPLYIEELYGGYRFYLRYYGGSIYPSEYVLIAIPD